MKTARHLRHVGSKWKKNEALLGSRELRTYLPETRKCNRTNLESMLMKYKMVYVKPINGSLGRGVMRVEIKPNSGTRTYQYQLEKKTRAFTTIDELYASIQKHKLTSSYLVQQGIHLLKYKKRRFDLRVMVQRSPEKVWKSTGHIGRLAHPKKIVTNYHSEGKPMAIELLLSPYIKDPMQMKSYIQMLRNLGTDIANHLKKSFPGIREIGVDIGIDQNMHPWIIEVNTSPDPFIFNQLKDKSMYRTVIRYSRLSGRFKHKK